MNDIFLDSQWRKYGWRLWLVHCWDCALSAESQQMGTEKGAASKPQLTKAIQEMGSISSKIRVMLWHACGLNVNANLRKPKEFHFFSTVVLSLLTHKIQTEKQKVHILTSNLLQLNHFYCFMNRSVSAEVMQISWYTWLVASLISMSHSFLCNAKPKIFNFIEVPQQMEPSSFSSPTFYSHPLCPLQLWQSVIQSVEYFILS